MNRAAIGFTGHRNCVTTDAELDKIRRDRIWVHGGASAGFDEQIRLYAVKHGIEQEIIRPDYRQYPGNIAPLKRNEVVVDRIDELVACYDGRWRGGTRYTINYAQRQGKPVIYVTCIRLPHPVVK